jgi:hypothetical protein
MTVDAYYAAVDAAEERHKRGMTQDEYHAHQTTRELREIADLDQMERMTRVTPKHG